MFDIKSVTKQLLDGCVIESHSGIRLYTPDGKGCYPALWTRDFAYMVEYAGDLIDLNHVRDCLEYLLAGADTNGWIPDRVEAAGAARYTAGGPEFPASPNLDNGSFLVIAANAYLDRLEQNAAKQCFLKWKNALCRGVDCLPVDEYGLIENCAPVPHSPYGFTDCIRKTGRLSMETLLLWRALWYIHKWLVLCGLDGDAYKQKAESIERNFGRIFTADSGMLYAATGICHQIDVWASCYAISIGFPLAARQRQQISDWLIRNKDAITECGQIRHLPAGEYWESTFVQIDENTYQNGAYWAVATGWFFDAIKETAPKLAAEVVDAVLTYFEKIGIYECVCGEYKKLDSYVVSATNVYAVYEQYKILRDEHLRQ